MTKEESNNFVLHIYCQPHLCLARMNTIKVAGSSTQGEVKHLISFRCIQVINSERNKVVFIIQLVMGIFNFNII